MVKKKEIKKREQKRKEELLQTLEVDANIKNLVINFLIVLIVFGMFYYITILIAKRNEGLNTIEKETIPTTIQYKEIIAGETFNRPDKEYYVLFYDFEGPNAAYYNTLLEESNEKIYTVDLNKNFNSIYISENTNKNVQKASDLKVKEDTLIKIIDRKNVSYFEGELTEIKYQLEK